jgi:drug/metabolite transporter (DMT)-like permease
MTALQRSNAMLGMGLGVLAYAAFSVHDADIKWLVEDLPIWEVVFARSATIFVASLLIGRRALVVRALTTPMRMALAGRGVLLLTAWVLYYLASRHLPLAQMLTLYFAAPILTTLMAAPLLGERVTRARWLSVGVGFVGVLVASDPFGLELSWPVLMVLGAAALWGYSVVLMRRIARRETSLLQMLFQNGFFMLVTGAGMALSWHSPGLRQVVLMLGAGVLGGIGQFCMFEAARHAPASVMATVEYTSLVWAFVLGYAIWGDIPDLAIWAGAALILAAGVVLVVAERRNGETGDG